MDAYSLYMTYMQHIPQTFENPAHFQHFKLGINPPKKNKTPTFQPWPIQPHSFHRNPRYGIHGFWTPQFSKWEEIQVKKWHFSSVGFRTITIYFSQGCIIIRKEAPPPFKKKWWLTSREWKLRHWHKIAFNTLTGTHHGWSEVINGKTPGHETPWNCRPWEKLSCILVEGTNVPQVKGNSPSSLEEVSRGKQILPDHPIQLGQIWTADL